jgi:hypothetical protein
MVSNKAPTFARFVVGVNVPVGVDPMDVRLWIETKLKLPQGEPIAEGSVMYVKRMTE